MQKQISNFFGSLQFWLISLLCSIELSWDFRWYHQWRILTFFGHPLIPKLLVRWNSPAWWVLRDQKVLNLILLHCWKIHLRHFPVILSSSRLFCFCFLFLLGARICIKIPLYTLRTNFVVTQALMWKLHTGTLKGYYA